MFSARVVFPLIAMFTAERYAHDLADPVSFDVALKTGPPPPAVWTHQPRRAKAATTAAIDLMKNSHRIFRGWIMTNGNCTIISAFQLDREPDSRVQNTTYATILGVVSPEEAGRWFGTVLSDGQMASSMISMQEAPIKVLILV